MFIACPMRCTRTAIPLWGLVQYNPANVVSGVTVFQCCTSREAELTMSEYIENLIESARNSEAQLIAQGKRPVLLLKMQDLEYHKVTIYEFAKKVNPFCAIISHLGVTSSEDSTGLPSGIIIESNYIVGHDKRQKELMWEMYSSNDAMEKTEYNASVVMVFEGSIPSRCRICMKTNDGPIFSEREYATPNKENQQATD